VVTGAPLSDAYAIFQRARSAVTSAAYPRRLDYTIAITGFDGDRPRQNHYLASSDPYDGSIRLFPISAEELAQPAPIPHGVRVSISIGIYGGAIVIPIGRPPPTFDLIGPPLLAPTYMFGLNFSEPAAVVGSAESNALPTIAVVSTTTRDYEVALLDAPSLDGVSTYHLKLTPLRKPRDNRLRELWVGENDYLPRKAVVAGNFTSAPLVDVPWTIGFSLFNGAPVIADERADATLYLPHRRTVREAEIAFEDVHERGKTIVGEPLVEPEAGEGTLTEPPGP
jgi:hypothetical protein